MRKYEVMVVIDPVLEDAKKDETVEAVQAIIAADGEVEKVDVWGMRKLAYPINKKDEGYYAVIEFQGNPTPVSYTHLLIFVSSSVQKTVCSMTALIYAFSTSSGHGATLPGAAPLRHVLSSKYGCLFI